MATCCLRRHAQISAQLPARPTTPSPFPLGDALARWILDPSLGGWPYPLSLTATHQAFCSLAAAGLVASGAADKPPGVSGQVFTRAIVPIGILFALSLWLANTAYVYLSVSFIQMLKASAPLAVYTVGCVIGTEKPSWRQTAGVLVVGAGTALATYGG